jgi:hypothetical protein
MKNLWANIGEVPEIIDQQDHYHREEQYPIDNIYHFEYFPL